MRLAVAGLLTTLAAAGPLLATSCSFPPPCQILHPGVVFFVGEFAAEPGVPVEQQDTYRRPTFKHRVLVREPLFGITSQTAELTVLDTSLNPAQESYLFHVYRQGDLFLFPICGASGPVDSRFVTPMLTFLRETRRGGDGKLTVSVSDRDEKKGHSIEGAAVAIDGPVRRETSTVKGKAEFLDLPPGEYRVSARSHGYEPDPSHPSQAAVTVLPKACPVQHLALRSVMELSGVVTSHTGQPAANVKLWLWEDKPRLADPSAKLYRGTTAEDGTFRFTRVKPGRYNLLTAGPEAKAYFPGRPTRAEAAPIEVNASQRLENLRLVLRDPGALRSVRFRVVNAQGRPMAGALLMDFNFDESFEQGGFSSIGDDVLTGPDGTVVVRLWENAHYRVDAHFGRSYTDKHVSPRVDVPPGKGDTEVTLMLQPWPYKPGTK